MSRTSSDGTELIFTVVLTLTRGLVYSSSRRRSSSLFGHIFSSPFRVEGKSISTKKLEVVHYCDIQKSERKKISFFIRCTASASSKILHSQSWPLTQDQNRLHTGDTSLKQINFIPRRETELAWLLYLSWESLTQCCGAEGSDKSIRDQRNIFIFPCHSDAYKNK